MALPRSPGTTLGLRPKAQLIAIYHKQIDSSPDLRLKMVDDRTLVFIIPHPGHQFLQRKSCPVKLILTQLEENIDKNAVLFICHILHNLI